MNFSCVLAEAVCCCLQTCYCVIDKEGGGSIHVNTKFRYQTYGTHQNNGNACMGLMREYKQTLLFGDTYAKDAHEMFLWDICLFICTQMYEISCTYNVHVYFHTSNGCCENIYEHMYGHNSMYICTHVHNCNVHVSFGFFGPLKDHETGVAIRTYERQMVDKYLYTKRRAIKGLNCSAISRALTSEGLSYSTKSVSLLLRKINDGGSFARKPGTGRSTKITQQVKDLRGANAG